MAKQQKPRPNSQRKQPRKDSESKRVNFDNTRETKFEKDVQQERHSRKGYDKPMKGAKFGGNCSNDVAWYAHTPELLKAAASVPFTDIVGDRMPTGVHSFPGIMVINWIPNLDGDALNQSANSHYSFTVHANSRNYQYNGSDQMMMIMAGASLFTALAAGIRAYGTMLKFNGLDKYTPQALIQAMGFDYTDLKANLSNMWFDLNEMITRSTQIWIPKDMPVIERWFWMTSHIYKDAQSTKSQYYMYVPWRYLQLSETGSQYGTSLTVVTPQQSQTWAQYKTMVNNMFNALLNSEDRGIIFGDLLAAYGADRIYGISGIDAGYSVTPVYDAEVLTQFENSTVNENCTIDGVFQDSNHVIYTKWAGVDVADIESMPGKAVLNFHQLQAPTPEQIMVATRMMTLGNQVAAASATAPGIAPLTAGTEIPVRRNIYSWNYGTTGISLLTTPDPLLYTTPLSNIQIMEHFSFDWAPALTTTTESVVSNTLVPGTVGSIGTIDPAYWLMDIDMFTWLDWTTLKKLHTTAIYSEFGVPTII